MIFSELINFAKLLLNSDKRNSYLLLKKLKKIPRYTNVSINLLGKEFKIVDSESFFFMYKEIFERQIYKFPAKSKNPSIIDCGANIGLSILYFKTLFPFSRIITFEPDKKIFDVLMFNINSFGLRDVKIENKAVWNSNTNIEFMSEGADGGRIVEVDSSNEIYSVPTIRLSSLLDQNVDFLKLDIEGSEFEVLKDCKDLLHNVKNLFVEYHSFTGQEQNLSIILNILYNAGFRVYIDQLRSIRQPFISRKTYLGMDMILNIFAYRK